MSDTEFFIETSTRKYMLPNEDKNKKETTLQLILHYQPQCPNESEVGSWMPSFLKPNFYQYVLKQFVGVWTCCLMTIDLGVNLGHLAHLQWNCLSQDGCAKWDNAPYCYNYSLISCCRFSGQGSFYHVETIVTRECYKSVMILSTKRLTYSENNNLLPCKHNILLDLWNQ